MAKLSLQADFLFQYLTFESLLVSNWLSYFRPSILVFQFVEHIAFSVQLFVNSYKVKLKYPMGHHVCTTYRKNTLKLKEKFPELAAELHKIKSSHHALTIEDHGAGSKKMNATRTISDIYKYNCTKGPYAKLLHLLPQALGCKHILELGTSLGISTYFFSQSPGVEKVVSIEGSEALSKQAQELLDRLNVTNTTLKNCLFAHYLAEASSNDFDLVYVDGHHSGQATIDYCTQLKDTMGKELYLLLDDIRWSKDMYRAFKTISNWEEVVETMDLARMGLVHLKRGVKEI